MAWELDAAHSQARFTVRRLANTSIQGRFNGVRGYLYIDLQKPSHSWVDVEVDAARVDTGDASLDARLRGKDVLDVEAYPTIAFKSSRVDHVEGQQYKVSGELTIHGVTREVRFGATFEDGEDRNKAGYPALAARTMINGRDYGLAGGGFSASEQVAAAEVVSIEIDLQLVSRLSNDSTSSAYA